ncbi:ABC transporter ATP-binding protein [Gorillibacterium sp. CAU 1737]|uniref:ABC transporter ATP-binding protein n=1 Tax=Gorillibacterium sp. CAU 1737 TaxID=3140362 RepID=UPI00326034CB
MIILEGKKLEKSFELDGGMVPVLRGVDVAIEKGSFVSIVGPSGSGKSTLLYVLSGLENSTHGEVRFEGSPLSSLGDAAMSKLRRTRFGFVFQFYNLVPTLTVEENIALPLELGNIRAKAYRDRVSELLEQVELTDKRKQFPYQLSGGQQQRVALARALAIDPAILFADEPTGNLDTRTGEEILRLLQTLSRERGMTVLMVTHDAHAASFGDRTIRLSDGRIICEEACRLVRTGV